MPRKSRSPENDPAEVLRRLTDAFHSYFAGNDGPGYGITVAAASRDLSEITFEVTFVADREYCCAEPGCHFGADWKRLREIARDQKLQLASPLTLRWHGVVQKGARLAATAEARGPTESEGYEYDAVFQEL